MLIIGDSLVSNLSHYLEIWQKCFINHGTLNFGIAGDNVKKTSCEDIYHTFQIINILLLPCDHKHSRRQGMITTVKKLLKFQCLTMAFIFSNLIQIG